MLEHKKTKTAFFCSQCGAEHTKWLGQCRECGAWNSLIEERKPDRRAARRTSAPAERLTIAQLSDQMPRGFISGIAELDRVLGGQLLPGMTVLLGGDPGIGKSTLMLQAAEAYGRQGIPVLYVTGEESPAQLKVRAIRLNVIGDKITVMNSTSLGDIIEAVAAESYGVIMVDSIQTVASDQFDSPPGTVAQVREVAGRLVSLAKETGFALFLVGHVTKDGLVAGPKVLEHMVDTVIYFEGDSSHLYRMLRAVKNRFGAVSEIGLFQMESGGLTEVANPSAFFLAGTGSQTRTGAVVTAVCEGNRPLLVEVQALAARASYGNPQRVAGGIDHRKLALLLAILEKRCDYPMSTHDVFISVAGGLRLSEPALDLPILAAITSSLLNKPVDHKTVVIGEVGLSGEVRGVTLLDRRLAEAAKLGFERAIVPEAGQLPAGVKGLDLRPVAELQPALDELFG